MKRYRSSASTITSRSSPSRRSSKGTLVPGPPRLQIFRYKSPSEEGVSPATLEIRSPGSTPARSAGPSGTAPETNKRSIASEAYSPSQGLGWPDARPRVTRSSRMGLRRSIGTNMLPGLSLRPGSASATHSEPIPRSFPSLPMRAEPLQLGWIGAVKMALSRRYSQEPANSRRETT